MKIWSFIFHSVSGLLRPDSLHPSEESMQKIIRLDDNEDLVDIRKDNVFKAVFTKDTPES